MEIQSVGHSELSVISQVSTVEGCLLSGGSTVYRYTIIQAIQDFMINLKTRDYTNYYSWLVKTQPNQLQAAIAAAYLPQISYT